MLKQPLHCLQIVALGQEVAGKTSPARMAAAATNAGVFVEFGDVRLKAVAGAIIDRFAVLIHSPLCIQKGLGALVRQDQCCLGIEAPIAFLAELDAVALSVTMVKVSFQGINGLAMRQVYAALAASFRDCGPQTYLRPNRT